jgi:hypothetical protein
LVALKRFQPVLPLAITWRSLAISSPWSLIAFVRAVFYRLGGLEEVVAQQVKTKERKAKGPIIVLWNNRQHDLNATPFSFKNRKKFEHGE